MADADEDKISSASLQECNEADDETQDFRFLSNLASTSSAKAQVLPKRGEKDFEPHPTAKQASVLEDARQAMHDALAVGRKHTAKTHVLGVYDQVNGGAWVQHMKGVMFKSMGRWVRDTSRVDDRIDKDERDEQDEQDEKVVEDEDAEPGETESIGDSRSFENANPTPQKKHTPGRLWLLPEEALFLIERGSLDIRWPVADNPLGDLAYEGLPMSLQGAYAAFIGMSTGLTLEMYTVYAGLKRAGYSVIRNDEIGKQFPLPQITYWKYLGSMWERLWQESSRSQTKRMALGPLIAPGLYRNYQDVYRRLSLIAFHDPAISSTQFPSIKPSIDEDSDILPDGTPRLHITFKVYKPSTLYKKSNPPSPDFTVCVVRARETSIPSLYQIDALFQEVPFEPPTDKQRDLRLKKGYRNVVLAVVDQGVVSYIRLGDSGFGKERLYEGFGGVQRGGRGGKRGGGRGGRGRGRGR